MIFKAVLVLCFLASSQATLLSLALAKLAALSHLYAVPVPVATYGAPVLAPAPIPAYGVPKVVVPAPLPSKPLISFSVHKLAPIPIPLVPKVSYGHPVPPVRAYGAPIRAAVAFAPPTPLHVLPKTPVVEYGPPAPYL